MQVSTVAVGVRDHELAGQHVAPVRRLAGVALEPLQQRLDVGAGAEGEPFPSHLAQAGCIAEVADLAGHGARDVDLGGDLLSRDLHGGLPSRWLWRECLAPFSAGR